MSDEFQVVTSRRKRKCQRGVKYASNFRDSSLLSDSLDEDSEVKKIHKTCNELKCTEFYSSVKDKIRQTLLNVKADSKEKKEDVDVVCYGLGNFSDCVIARYQLALLLALREDLQISDTPCHIYDPKFLNGEVNILSTLGLLVMGENEEGKRRCTGTTLFYMPHCGKALYNNVLWANWDPKSLKHIIIIGNSFSNVSHHTYIQRISDYCQEEVFPANFQFLDVFNDTAIHTFPSDKIVTMPTDFWKDNNEPVYTEDDLEFIPKNV